MTIPKLFKSLTLAWLLTTANLCWAEMIVFSIDPSASSLTFTGSLRVPVPGGATVAFPVVANIPGDNLTTALGGTVMADPTLGSFVSGGAVNQLDLLQGSIMNPTTSPATRVGSMSLPNLSFVVNAALQRLITQSGTISYSVASASPALNINGSAGLAGGPLVLGTPTFGNVGGLRTVDATISFDGLLPTTVPGVSIDTHLTGTIHAIEISAVPEPTHLALLSIACVAGSFVWKRRAIFNAKKECRTSYGR